MVLDEKWFQQLCITESIRDGYLDLICRMYISAQEISDPECREEMELIALDRLDHFLRSIINAFDLPNHLE